jgi:hypothetical protein
VSHHYEILLPQVCVSFTALFRQLYCRIAVYSKNNPSHNRGKGPPILILNYPNLVPPDDHNVYQIRENVYWTLVQ